MFVILGLNHQCVIVIILLRMSRSIQVAKESE